ncbi:hypothetical protein ASG76_07715 [Nocardioides sp. Soil774]|uniref:hypothetical protein n=1 Tax=Nocardioides sp. Soil774 TaxID=1736408 RepID=UPI0006FC3A48|nr:hypothetical protein [Nocardioides sp. Soil774]KRE95519.1 hypothetical protein ASG76_07715 [Nocardioides sp. Soil774]
MIGIAKVCRSQALTAGLRHTQVMGLSGDIRTTARRVSWRLFSAGAAVALFASCAVVALATRSVPPVLALLVGGLVVVFLAGLTLDALKAPFDRAPGPRSGSRGGWI